MSEDEHNIKPSELFGNKSKENDFIESNTQNTSPNKPPINIEIPELPENQEPESPALYKGTPEQDKILSQQKSLEQNNLNPNRYDSLDYETLKRFLIQKDKEMMDLSKAFNEIKSYIDTIQIEKENLLTQIETLKSQIEMKNTQISTLKDTIKMKDEQLAMKDDKIKMKEDQMEIYQQSIRDKEKFIEDLKQNSIPGDEYKKLKDEYEQLKKQLEEKDRRIEDLENEIKAITEDLTAADDEIEKLYKEIEQLKNRGEMAIYMPSSKIKERVHDILLNKALHNVNLTVPNITDLLELDIFDVKSSVSLKVSAAIDPSNEQHKQLLEEFGVFDNIQIKEYDRKDRFVILADGAYLLFAAKGKNGDEYLVIYTEDPQHIQILNPLVMESWLRARKV